MSAASTLQKAIFARLSGDVALTALVGTEGIADRRLTAPASPLVVIASIDSADHSTATEAGEEHAVVLEVWSGAAGHREAQGIAAAICLVLLLHRETRLKRDGASKFHRAEMRFRAVTEPDG